VVLCAEVEDEEEEEESREENDAAGSGSALTQSSPWVTTCDGVGGWGGGIG
jgi:hypothetical protein